MTNFKNKDEWVRDLENRLINKGDTAVGYAISGNFNRWKHFSENELRSILIELIKKNEKKVHKSVWEKLNETDVAWAAFCQSFGKESHASFGWSKPPFTEFSLTAAGRGELKGILLLSCGDNITISKYGKKLAKGIINMESMIRMWSNTRPEIVGVTYCEVDTRVGNDGYDEYDYAPYLAIKVGIKIDLLAYFE